MRLELIEPRSQRDHRLRAEPKDPNSGIFWRTFVGDDAGLEQYPKVLAHRRCGKTGGFRELSSAPGPGAQ
jgi:hypothetical protein